MANLWKNLFNKPQPTDAPAKTPKVKRNWWAEWKDFVTQHLLTLQNFDSTGTTEKLTLAWFTKAARKARNNFSACWGPYGLFLNQNCSVTGFYASVILDLGCTCIGVGLVIGILWWHRWFLALFLTLIGVRLVVTSYPQVEFWDLDCGPEEAGNSWDTKKYSVVDKILKLNEVNVDPSRYRWFRKPITVANVNAPSFDVCLLQTFPPFVKKPISKLHPERLAVYNAAQLKHVALFLTTYACRTPTIMTRSLTKPSRDEVFSFSAFRDDLLLLNYARSPHGYSEYFFSFAFLAPRTIKSRKREPNLYGLGRLLKWPYVLPGAPLRNCFFGFGIWLILIGSLALYYSGWGILWYKLIFTFLILVGLIVCVIFGPSLEDWYGAEVFGFIAPKYPYQTEGWYWRYWTKEFLSRYLRAHLDSSVPFSLTTMIWISFFVYYFF